MSARHTCVACLRALDACTPDPEDGSFFSQLLMVSFTPSKASARGRLCVCRDCSREIVAAFAHAAVALAREAPTEPPPGPPKRAG
jgi:hypothetical protein